MNVKNFLHWIIVAFPQGSEMARKHIYVPYSVGVFVLCNFDVFLKVIKTKCFLADT